MKINSFFSMKNLLIAMWLIVMPCLLCADELSSSYAIGVSTSYDDNINGSVTEQRSGTAQIISPSFKNTWMTETSNTDIDLNFDFYKYNRPGYDTDNQRASLTNRWNYLESQQISLSASLIRDSTATSEAQVQDTGVAIQERVSERRIQKNFSPSWSWSFSEQNRFNLSYRYSEVDYGDLENSGYTNTDEYSLTPSISHALGEDWSVFLQADYSVSNTDERDLSAPFSFSIIRGPYGAYSTQTTTKGFAVGSNYLLTENWRLNGYIGKNTSDGEYDVNTVTTIAQICQIQSQFAQSLPECRTLASLSDYTADGSYANISLTWSQELWDFEASYNSNVSPSSDGYSQQSDRWSLSSTYKITESQSLSASVGFYENTVVDQNAQAALGFNRDREITTAQLSWNYQIYEDWSLSASYGYDETAYAEAGSNQALTVESKTASIGLAWRPQKMIWAN